MSKRQPEMAHIEKKDYKAGLEHFAGDNGARCHTLMDLCFKDTGYMARKPCRHCRATIHQFDLLFFA